MWILLIIVASLVYFGHESDLWSADPWQGAAAPLLFMFALLLLFFRLFLLWFKRLLQTGRSSTGRMGDDGVDFSGIGYHDSGDCDGGSDGGCD